MKDNKSNIPFGKKNYMLMIIGVCIIALGLIIMSMDNEQHGFGFLGLTLGPLVILGGFAFEFYAIFAQSDAVNAMPEVVKPTISHPTQPQAQKASAPTKSSSKKGKAKRRR